MPVERVWGTGCMSSASPYVFQVFPGRSDRLMLYYQGGGACWDALSAASGLCQQEIDGADMQGVFDRADASNPYRNFTFLHVNYCSGDAHAGNSSHPWGRQAGYNNTKAALAWAKMNMDAHLDHLAIMGASAGSLAVQVWARTLLHEFKADGRSYRNASVVADSYIGIFPQRTMPHILSAVFRTCSTPLGQGWKLKCGGGLEVKDFVTETMTAFKSVPFLFINSKADRVQIEYYAALAYTLLKRIEVLSPEAYYQQANAYFAAYSRCKNFALFQVDGGYHVYLPHPRCERGSHNCWGNVYDATPSGPLAALSSGGGEGKTLLSAWLDNVVNGDCSVVCECDGTAAVYSPLKPFPVQSCAKSLVGRRIET